MQGFGWPNAPDASQTPQQQQNPSLSTGAKAGIGVGAAIGVITILGAIFFAYKARSWKKRATNPSPYYVEGGEHADYPRIEKCQYAGYPPSELLDGRTAAMELTPASPTKLPGNGLVIPPMTPNERS
ncbi:hypothetical protein K469DRAFT_695437 [Zopfia rhizophila CBS 207.26]|uniref:Mid2 domain-containing protein n=1 Tax=Zopfia rhizophila CBS 207.26 TaxID=1314779 RepID=A0A6A6DK92_9PEZI|nr:hypothetical protein K469DRAFT_695437 [Zopfia rhizophila CBS 207.26]